MGLINWIVQRTMIGEAKRVAKEVRKQYDTSKTENPTSEESVILRRIVFADENFDTLSEDTRERFQKCCETIQGFSYMIVLDLGRLKGWMNFCQLQFTHYMDFYLSQQGFPPQSKEQKERILEAMGLNIPNWDKYSGD